MSDAELADRLDAHAEQLERNKSLPWLGLGLHRDLRVAAQALRGLPAPAPSKEYDL